MPAPPTTGNGAQMSQRAVIMSVGALALSVIAIATMFVFVYSQGAGALRAGESPPQTEVQALQADAPGFPATESPSQPEGAPVQPTSLQPQN